MPTEALDDVRARATALLGKLRNAGAGSAADLKPRPTDIASVFTADLVEKAIAHYAPLWAQPVEIRARPDQSELVVHAALAKDLPGATFPGGYKHVVSHLVPGRIWIAWKYFVPGERLGMAYDGLVWVDDHFAWFPKPWRMVPKPGDDPFYVD